MTIAPDWSRVVSPPTDPPGRRLGDGFPTLGEVPAAR